VCGGDDALSLGRRTSYNRASAGLITDAFAIYSRALPAAGNRLLNDGGIGHFLHFSHPPGGQPARRPCLVMEIKAIKAAAPNRGS